VAGSWTGDIPVSKLKSASGYVHSKPAIVQSIAVGGSSVGFYTYRNGSTDGAIMAVVRHPAAQTVEMFYPEGLVFSTKIYLVIVGSNKKVSQVRFFRRPSD
jgi:hypothetical protein